MKRIKVESVVVCETILKDESFIDLDFRDAPRRAGAKVRLTINEANDLLRRLGQLTHARRCRT